MRRRTVGTTTDRRTILRATGAVAAAALGGCMQGGNDEGAGDDTEGGNETESGIGVTLDDGEVDDGTLSAVKEILRSRLAYLGHENATVSAVKSENRPPHLRVSVDSPDAASLVERIAVPGSVEITLGYPTEGADRPTTETLLTRDDFAIVEKAEPPGPSNRRPRVPVTLTQEAAQLFIDRLIATGFTDEGVNSCSFDASEDSEPIEGEYCIYTVVDGEITYGASVTADLAEGLENSPEEFVDVPSFVIQTSSFEKATQIGMILRTERLPTEVTVVSE